MRKRDASKAASKARTAREPFEFEDQLVAAGTSKEIEVKVARLPLGTWATMPTAILHGHAPGPTIWLNGAIHGDELNGVEIVRRLLTHLDPSELSGTAIAVPIVNVFGVSIGSRYLPDRRDLNRSFPGAKRGSLASRLARLFFERVARRCELGIDFHTGSGGRSNWPQVRCDLDDQETRRHAEAFAPPLLLHSTLRDGSLREAARKEGIRVLIYEAGEASRFDETAIQVGVDGTLRVLGSLGMIRHAPEAPWVRPRVARESRWMRAGRSGFSHIHVEPGATVAKGDCVATVSDSIGKKEMSVRSTAAGVVIGVLRTALVHRGDALVHVAELES